MIISDRAIDFICIFCWTQKQQMWVDNIIVLIMIKLKYIISNVKVEDAYVARRKAHHDHHHTAGVDYYVGRYAPKEIMGRIFVNVDNIEKV